MRVVAIATQKGGEGKTTTAAALAAGLILKGYKVLAVDMDSQQSLSFIMGADCTGITVMDILTGKAGAAQAIQHTPSGDIIPGHEELAKIDVILGDDLGKPFKLKKALEPVKELYDYVIVDTPPALSTLTANALTAADSLIIPAQADISSIQGIAQIKETIEAAQEYTNPDLKVLGLLMVRHNPRTNLTKTIQDQLEKDIAPLLDTRIFNTTIREAVAIREAKCKQEPIYQYAPRAKVTGDYLAFIEEFIEREGARK
jgi:chromosome partitioning protein